MKYIDEVEIKNRKVLLRVDFNVPLNPDKTVANDERIKASLPTLSYLLKNNNKLILISHLGRPKARDEAFSLKPIADKLQRYLPAYKIILIDDFLNNNETMKQSNNEILLLENIRFYEGEKKNDPEFIKKLASLADVFVNDAFAVCHRNTASVVGITTILPSYGGLLVKKEVTMLSKIIQNPQKPVVAILAGSKISTKVGLIERFIEIADHILLGGGLANTMLLAQGKQVGQSLVEKESLELAKTLLAKAQAKGTDLVIPTDAIIQTGDTKSVDSVGPDDNMLDIGPESRKHFAEVIAAAKTIIWNGPVGMFEDPKFKGGSDAIYDAIIANTQAVSILGGGDTLSAIADKPGKEKITHISTAGGAMLEFIEKNGALPGITALENAKS